MAYFDRSKQKFSLNEYPENFRILNAMVTDVIKWHREPLASKCQIHDCQNKDRLSVCRILLLQRKLNWAGRNTRLGRGLDIQLF